MIKTNDIFSQTIGDSGPELVLLHGWGMNSAIWTSLANELSQYCRVTLIDLPGCGRSSYQLVNGDLAEFAEAILSQVEGPAIWLGWSLGGLIATQIALMAPERVLGLTIAASSPCFLATDDWPGMKWEILKDFTDLFSEDYERAMDRFISLQLLRHPQTKQLKRQLKQDLFAAGQPEQQALQAGLEILRITDLRKDLKQIKTPMLYLLGEHDTLVSQAIGEKLDCQVEVLTRAGHLLFCTHQQLFVEKLLAFLITHDLLEENDVD